jgi:hypothetical protein
MHTKASQKGKLSHLKGTSSVSDNGNIIELHPAGEALSFPLSMPNTKSPISHVVAPDPLSSSPADLASFHKASPGIFSEKNQYSSARAVSMAAQGNDFKRSLYTPQKTRDFLA